MPPFLVMPGSLLERYFCLSLIEPCNIVKIVVVFSDRKAASITHTHSDARFAFKSFDVNGGFNIGIRFVAKYSLVFQIQLIKVQQILLGASITVCKKKIKIVKIYSTFSTIPSERGFLFGRIMLKVQLNVLQQCNRVSDFFFGGCNKYKVVLEIIFQIFAEFYKVRRLDP